MSQDKGGACVAKTNNYYVIGTWNSAINMENGSAPNPGALNGRVEGVANYLIGQNS